MIRFLLVLVLCASAASGQRWPARAGDEHGVLHEYEHPVAAWYGLTVSDRIPATAAGDRDAIGVLADAIGINTQQIEYEQRSAHIAGVRAPRASESPDGYRYAVSVSAETSTERGERAAYRLHRTWFRFRSPDAPRGTAVLMPGMLGTPHTFIDRFEHALYHEGWAVLRMLVPPSRSTEHLPVSVDLGDPSPSIERLARELDTRAAECAYAVEAGLAWADSIEPTLAASPRVVIGMSGTGMMLPAVLAWNDNAFDAGVIIGSGANAFKILRETAYADLLDAVRVTWTPAKPDADQTSRLDAEYLRHAQVDAYALAPLVTSKTSLLLIDGSADRAVPAASGDLLWERLERPERWTTPIGHELLFVRTLLQINQIIGWLNDRTEAGEP